MDKMLREGQPRTAGKLHKRHNGKSMLYIRSNIDDTLSDPEANSDEKPADSGYHLYDADGHIVHAHYNRQMALLIVGVFIFFFFLAVLLIVQAALWPTTGYYHHYDDGDTMTARMAFEASLEYQQRYESERREILKQADQDCPRGMHAWLPDNERDSLPRIQDTLCMVNFFTPNANDPTLLPEHKAQKKAACSAFAFEEYACANWYSDYEANEIFSPQKPGTTTKEQLEHQFHSSRAFSQLAYSNKKLLDDVVQMVSTYSPLGWSTDGKHSPLGGDHEEGYFRRLVTACINSTVSPGQGLQLPGDIHVFWDMATELGSALSHIESTEDSSRLIGQVFGRAQCMGVTPVVRVTADSHFMDRTKPVLMVEPQLPLLSKHVTQEQTYLLLMYCSVVATLPEYSDSVGTNDTRDLCVRQMKDLSSAMHSFERRQRRSQGTDFFDGEFWTGFISGMSGTSAMARIRGFESAEANRGCLSPESANEILSLTPNSDQLLSITEDLLQGADAAMTFYAHALSSESRIKPGTWKMLLYVGLVADYLEYTDHVRLATYIIPLYDETYGYTQETNVEALKHSMAQSTPWMQGHVKSVHASKHKKDMEDRADRLEEAREHRRQRERNHVGHHTLTRQGDGDWHGKAASWASGYLKKLAMLGVSGHYEYGNTKGLTQEQRNHLVNPARGELKKQEDSAKWETCSKLAAVYLPSAMDDAFASLSLSEGDIERVTMVTELVLDALVESIQNSKLLTAEARDNLVRKARAIAIRVAVPWGNNPDRKPTNHDAMGILGDSLWQDTCSIRMYSTRNNLESAFAPASSPEERRTRMMYQNGGVDHFGMPTSAVNAYYSPEENSISILAGIIAPPFYHKDYTMQSLLATIGSIIGHELSHAFDSSGVMFDPLGSYVIPEKGEDSGWMSASDIEAYEEREQCFVHRYNVTSRMGNKIDSVKTLGENIADTMGLRASFDAFVKLQGGRDIEPEVMREFIEAYSQMWCTNASPDVELMQTMLDPHSPGGTRINGAISSLYFSSASGGKDPLRTAYGCSDKDKRSSKKNGPCALW